VFFKGPQTLWDFSRGVCSRLGVPFSHGKRVEKKEFPGVGCCPPVWVGPRFGEGFWKGGTFSRFNFGCPKNWGLKEDSPPPFRFKAQKVGGKGHFLLGPRVFWARAFGISAPWYSGGDSPDTG